MTPTLFSVSYAGLWGQCRLDVEPGTAALEVRRTYVTSDGEIAQVTINTHPGNRYRHSMTLRRVRT